MVLSDLLVMVMWGIFALIQLRSRDFRVTHSLVTSLASDCDRFSSLLPNNTRINSNKDYSLYASSITLINGFLSKLPIFLLLLTVAISRFLSKLSLYLFTNFPI